MKKCHLLYFFLVGSLISAGPAKGMDGPRSEEVPNPPLMTAIDEENLPEVTRLLEEGADPNLRNSATCTPLFFAINKKDPILTRLLLEHGADPNAIYMPSSKDSWKELDNAIVFGTEEHVQLLLKYGADPFLLKKTSKKASPDEIETAKQNILLVQAERMKRVTTLLLCLKKEPWDNLLDLPAEIREMIKGAVQEICTK